MISPPTNPPTRPWPRKSQRDFWRSVCSPQSRHPDSLYWYMKKIHGMDNFMRANPTKQWFVPSVHKPYCRWKQNHYYRFFDAYKSGAPCRVRLMTAVPRGYLKSTIEKGTLMWSHLENPGLASYLGSSDDPLAQELFSSIPKIYKGEDEYATYHLHYGNWFDSTRQITKSSFVHAARKNTARQEPSFKTFSIKTGFKGHHPDISVMDDPVDREKLRDEGSIHLADANQSVVNARWAMPQCSIQELVGSRYHDDDPQGHYQRLEGVKSWSGHPLWDPEVKITPTGEWDVYHLAARDPDTNQTIAPEINTTEDLDKAETANSLEFWNQMMNQPARGDHMGLDFKILEAEILVNLEHVPPGYYIIVVDTAFKDFKKMQQGGCESVFLIFKRDNRPSHADYYYMEGYGSRTDRIEDFTTQVVMKIQEYNKMGRRIALITDERSPGKTGAWFHYLQERCHSVGTLMPPTKELVRGGDKRNKKIQRIRVAAGFWAAGRVKIVRGAPGARELMSQMARFEVSKLIDRADAAADIFHPDVYEVMTLIVNAGGSGVRQVGPFDDDVAMDGNPTHQSPSTEVYDTIFEQDPWN